MYIYDTSAYIQKRILYEIGYTLHENIDEILVNKITSVMTKYKKLFISRSDEYLIGIGDKTYLFYTYIYDINQLVLEFQSNEPIYDTTGWFITDTASKRYEIPFNNIKWELHKLFDKYHYICNIPVQGFVDFRERVQVQNHKIFPETEIHKIIELNIMDNVQSKLINPFFINMGGRLFNFTKSPQITYDIEGEDESKLYLDNSEYSPILLITNKEQPDINNSLTIINKTNISIGKNIYLLENRWVEFKTAMNNNTVTIKQRMWLNDQLTNPPDWMSINKYFDSDMCHFALHNLFMKDIVSIVINAYHHNDKLVDLFKEKLNNNTSKRLEHINVFKYRLLSNESNTS